MLYYIIYCIIYAILYYIYYIIYHQLEGRCYCHQITNEYLSNKEEQKNVPEEAVSTTVICIRGWLAKCLVDSKYKCPVIMLVTLLCVGVLLYLRFSLVKHENNLDC